MDQGTKLSLQSQISDFPIGSGGFLVLVPFGKKVCQQVREIDESALTSAVSSESLASDKSFGPTLKIWSPGWYSRLCVFSQALKFCFLH
ncbi:hypothetical protein ACH5RR_004028 [Cinchona calisaya]|uniref:Uncharacterized protein n=1 Tax=Cinchona calisaya TaxID=153742 RepID=A0ABD3AWD9_9GENT